MSLDGKFEWNKLQRKGGQRGISFVLTNTNLLRKDTFNCVLIDSQNPSHFQKYDNLELDSRKSFRFDFDTVDWEWCPGDSFLITDRKGNQIKKWVCSVPVYSQGECPDCHGTQKCKYCGGSGIIRDTRYSGYQKCSSCYGTGICQTCYVPTRTQNNAPLNSLTPDNSQRRRIETKIAALEQRISEYQHKIQMIDMDLRIWELKDLNLSCKVAYQAKLSEKFNYSNQIIKLQSDLNSLQNILFQMQ